MRSTLILLASLAVLSTASPAIAADKPQLLVLDLQRGPEFDAGLGRTLTDLVTNEVGKEQAVTAISGAELRSLAKLEGDKVLAGCNVDSCLAELAGALGARFVLTGRVSSIGEIKVMQMSIFDATTATAISREGLQAKDVGGFVERIPGGVDRLLAPMRALLVKEAAALVAEAKATSATNSTNSTNTTSTTSNATAPEPATGSNVDDDAPKTVAVVSPATGAPTSSTAENPRAEAPPNPQAADPYANASGDGAEPVEAAGGFGIGGYTGVVLAIAGSIGIVGGGAAAIIGGLIYITPAPGEPIQERYIGGGAAAIGAAAATTAVVGTVIGVALIIGGLSE